MIKNVEAVDALLPEVEKKTFGFLMNLTVELHYSLSFMMWAHLESGKLRCTELKVLKLSLDYKPLLHKLG